MTKFIWDREHFKKTGHGFVPAHRFKRPAKSGIMIHSDLEPYENIIDGTVVDGRAAHREFLKKHDVREVGNERPRTWDPYDDVPPVGPDLKRAFEELSSRG